jgi:drug/metabolite transporter (DMT)-like permease
VPERFKTVALTLLALVAFASNSILTRLALGARQIDAATFTSIRLAAGALVLALLVRVRVGNFEPLRARGALGPLTLFAYAAPFSFAYLRIGAAVGALVAFGVVQLTMIGYGIWCGERPALLAWLGLVLSAAGMCLLTIPAASRPDPLGIMLIAVAGAAWGAYSIAGRIAPDPIAANARAFAWSCPLSLLANLMMHGSAFASGRGIALALVSGALTSGLGYAIWYRALPRLAVTQAAVAQLSVPVIAALGATVFLGERLSARLVLSGVTVLSGVALVLSARARGRPELKS